MYTRKLTTKTRKGKKTMGKRVGKSINKNRNNRNNNRRTKRAGDLTKYIQAPSIGKTLAVTGSAAAQGIRNAQAGFAIVKILKKPLPSDESSRKTELINRYNQIVPILKETLIGNVKVARMGADAVFNTKQLKEDAQRNFGFNVGQKSLHQKNQAGYPQLVQPGVYPQIVPSTGQQQGGPFSNVVR